MESFIRRLKIQTLKANLRLTRFACVALARANDQSELTTEQRIQLVRRWDAVFNEGQVMRWNLAILKRQEEESDH